MKPSMLEDEFDRFKIWSGNLGALQKGHACLEVLTDKRLPYEEQQTDSDSDSDDTESTTSDHKLPELVLRSQSITDTIRSLYKLSFSIRRPGAKVAPEKAMLYREAVPGTEFDFGDAFRPLDRLHVIALLNDLRKEALAKSPGTDISTGDSEFPDASEYPLIDRLADAITKRRRKFKYWVQHRENLAKVTDEADKQQFPSGKTLEGNTGEDRDLEKQKKSMHAPSQSQGPLTETVATKYIPVPITQDDAASIAPTASTAKDLEGHEAMLPRPPETDGDDFECPYCFVLCPGKEATRNRWRKHMLEDLQPYICTYTECKLPGQLFGSRTAWLMHEDSCHRQLWICRDHQDLGFATSESYRLHLENSHQEIKPEHLQAIVESSSTSREDTRDTCPLCLIPIDRLAKSQNLLKHIAHHLERIACFALPRNMELDNEMDGNDSLKLRSDQSDDSRKLSDLDSLRTNQSKYSQGPSAVSSSAHHQSGQMNETLDSDSVRSDESGKSQSERNPVLEGLLFACKDGQTSEVQRLLEQGIDPNTDLHSREFKNGLQAASANGHEDVVRLLLDGGAAFNVQGGRDGTALQAASLCGHARVVELLLEVGADVDTRGGPYACALSAASASGHELVVQILLDAGADVNIRDERSRNALEWASIGGHFRVAQELIRHGAHPVTSVVADGIIEGQRQLVKWAERLEGKHHYDAIQAKCKLSNVFRALGKAEDAEQLLLQTLEGIEEESEAGPAILEVIDTLSFLYKDQGRLEEAKGMQTRCANESTRFIGQEHPDTLRRLHLLADLQRLLGKYGDACKVRRRILAVSEKVLGKENPETLNIIHDLAAELQLQGEHVESEEMFRQALGGKEKVLGPAHPSTLFSVKGFALLMEDLVRYDEAIPLLERAERGFEKRCGREDFRTKECREALERVRRLKAEISSNDSSKDSQGDISAV
ncbi:hypothetical protein Q7P37_007487 [Cladosporium fusiforme]